MRRRQQGVVFFVALLMAHTLEIAAVGGALAALYNGEKAVQGAVELYRTLAAPKPAEQPAPSK